MPSIHFILPDKSSHTAFAEDRSSAMRAAVENDVPGIVGECGGSMTCATCHVYVDDAWIERVGEPSEEESFMLEISSEIKPTSRLACQIVMTDRLDGLRLHIRRG